MKAYMATKKAPPIGKLIDDLWELREQKRTAEANVKIIEGKIALAEAAVMAAMDEQKVTKSTGSKATVSVGASTQFNIADFDALAKYVKRTGYFHLFQRRVTVEAARELFEKNGAVPGLEPYEKRKLNILTVK